MTDMQKNNKWLLLSANILLFFFVIIFTISGVVDISIKNATPLVLITLVTAFSIFNSVGKSVFAGLVTGACLDSVQVGSYCFNTISFVLLAVLVYLIANNLFNKNIQSALTLSLIVSVLYFVAKWGIYFTVNLNMKDSAEYFLGYALPSAVYSSVFILPFFYLYRFFNKLENQ